jgi:hypothetical protein
VKVFVICRDRLEPLKQLMPWIEHHEVHLVDNDSAYPPLLEYYKTVNATVHKTGSNLGHRAPWVHDLVPKNERYIVTDPDVIPHEDCPLHYANVMSLIMDSDPNIKKVGFGLKIDDIPDHYAGKEQVLKWETPLWGCHTEIQGYSCHEVPIDTTFALYREGTTVGRYESPSDLYPAIRLGAPFYARHLPWYGDSANPTEEDLFYKKRAEPTITNWTITGASKSHGG